jgi:hypothetical protein
MTSAVKNIDLIFFMNLSSLFHDQKFRDRTATNYFAGLALIFFLMVGLPFPKLLSGFFRLRSDWPGVPDAAAGSAEHLAEARAGAGLGCAARSHAGRQYAGFLLQLHGGSRAGAENAQDQCGKERRFGFFIHVRSPFLVSGTK